jgi:hypothetical protein
MRAVDTKDVCGGGILAFLGLYFVVEGWRLGIGSLTSMGPGFFPLLVGCAGILIGGGLVVSATARSGALGTVEWRPLIAVTAALAVFALTIERFGLIVAIALATSIAAFGDQKSRPWQIALLTLAVCLLIWLVFSVGLGLTIPLLRVP